MTTAVNATLAGQRPLFTLTPLGALVGNLGAGAKNLFAGVANPDAVIAALFANNEQGVWYDPSDLSTMFQDSAGTTPVTADGQPVGLIRDKSGRNNHATQATAAARPLYKTSGGLHWLQFDGVNNWLSTSAVDFTSTNKMNVFAGVRIVGTGSQCIQESSSTRQQCYVNTAFIANQPYLAKLSDGTNTLSIYQTSPVAVPKTNVVYMKFDYAGAIIADEVGIRVNGSSIVTSTGQAGQVTSVNFLNQPIYIGARSIGDTFLNGNIYSLIVRCALSTTQEITDTETWVNGKTGAY